ncbi:hypothetical protein WM23_26765 [Burkholderia ubonensis]|nr:hypothetical protein WM23_26765 [Burkholderia ubonensis]
MMTIMVGNDNGPGFIFGPGGVGSFAGSWTNSSDYRLKRNLTPIDPDSTLAALMRTKPWEYDRIENALAGRRFAGFIAHELQEEFPLLVHGEKDATRESFGEIEPDYQSVDYIAVAPYLTAALQAVVRRLEALETQRAK